MRLYIIGNGFDLFHKFKSSYTHFRNYLEENNEELLSFLETYYSLNSYDNSWNYFEKQLSNFQVEEFLNESKYIDHLPNYADFEEGDIDFFPAEVDKELIEKQEVLRKSFEEWIMKIELKDCPKILKLEMENSIFFTFNYTKTLEDIYKIPSSNILHIHNYICHQKEPLLFGHGFSEKKIWKKKKGKINRYSTDGIAYESGINKVYSFLAKFYKNPSDNISKHIDFFDKIKNVTEIYVLGHSLSDIDMPYYKKISEYIKIKEVQWVISFHQKNEIKKMISQIKKLNVQESNYTFIKMDTLPIKVKQLELNF